MWTRLRFWTRCFANEGRGERFTLVFLVGIDGKKPLKTIGKVGKANEDEQYVYVRMKH